jgi:hypothetical protein
MITRILNNLRGQWIGVVALFIALGGTGYAAISIPRHSVGRGQLRNGAVGETQLGKRSVGATQLRTHAVTQRAINGASVGSRQLRKGSVRGTQLAPGSVTSSKIGAGQVTASQIAAGAIGNGQIAAGAVGSGQLAAGAVGSGQLAAGSVGSGQLAAGSVGPGNLTGIGGYTLAFAVVNPQGGVVSSPSATTSGFGGQGSWSNGNGEVHFQTSAPSACLAFSDAPYGNDDGSLVDTTAALLPEGATEVGVQVATSPTGGSTPTIAVWIECVA